MNHGESGAASFGRDMTSAAGSHPAPFPAGSLSFERRNRNFHDMALCTKMGFTNRWELRLLMTISRRGGQDYLRC